MKQTLKLTCNYEFRKIRGYLAVIALYICGVVLYTLFFMKYGKGMDYEILKQEGRMPVAWQAVWLREAVLKKAQWLYGGFVLFLGMPVAEYLYEKLRLRKTIAEQVLPVKDSRRFAAKMIAWILSAVAVYSMIWMGFMCIRLGYDRIVPQEMQCTNILRYFSTLYTSETNIFILFCNFMNLYCPNHMMYVVLAFIVMMEWIAVIALVINVFRYQNKMARILKIIALLALWLFVTYLDVFVTGEAGNLIAIFLENSTHFTVFNIGRIVVEIIFILGCYGLLFWDMKKGENS